MHLTGHPVGKFDPEGLIFAVRLYSEPVELYDLRAFDKGPLNTFKLPRTRSATERGGHPPHRRLPGHAPAEPHGTHQQQVGAPGGLLQP
ncbi:hypothetical protein HPB47_023888 [Ixodes persulcatus]|uniref:Uncharacterized protein n=1 Tax=Ixodes persulcatus TaxID=34615 RepID=A0AC60Q5Q3_IXOPE|nr:hypothetical protein HPB47_023888 [Ixodes persulcatus]